MTDLERALGEYVNGMRLHQVLVVDPDALDTQFPPSFQLCYNGASMLILPTVVLNVLMRVEIMSFDADGNKRQHLHLALT